MDGPAIMAAEVRERFTVRFGPEVPAWCDRLPSLVERSAARWGLDVLAVGGGGTSRVFRCLRRADGALVPHHRGAHRGIAVVHPAG